MEKTYDQMRKWLTELVPYRQYDNYVSEEDRGEYGCRFYIYTNRNRYQICVHLGGESDYLGAQFSRRKPDAGDTHVGGGDMPDGKYNQRTWDHIRDRILANELVALSLRSRGLVDYQGEEETEETEAGCD